MQYNRYSNPPLLWRPLCICASQQDGGLEESARRALHTSRGVWSCSEEEQTVRIIHVHMCGDNECFILMYMQGLYVIQQVAECNTVTSNEYTMRIM